VARSPSRADGGQRRSREVEILGRAYVGHLPVEGEQFGDVFWKRANRVFMR
jgi:hypothetical protein